VIHIPTLSDAALSSVTYCAHFTFGPFVALNAILGSFGASHRHLAGSIPWILTLLIKLPDENVSVDALHVRRRGTRHPIEAVQDQRGG
jgi:hypothetical protein